MIESMRVRTVLVLLFLGFCAVYLLPNLVNLPDSYPLHNKKLHYGLDIQGGAHLVYGVDVNGVMTERIERLARTLTAELKDAKVDAESVKVGAERASVVVRLKNEADRPKVNALLKEHYSTTLQTVRDDGPEVEAKYFDSVVEQWRTQVINQAIEVIRNRVDEFGVAEPVIAAQGRDRILVQLPGITDPARAKELINKTARLDFRLVDPELSPAKLSEMVAEVEKAQGFKLISDTGGEKPAGGLTYAAYYKKVNEALAGKLPANTIVAFEKPQAAASLDVAKVPHLVRTDTDVGGDLLEDASVRPGQYGEPTVSFRFGSEGKRKFGALTGANIGKQLAIVLDNVVYSAPVIQSRIDGEGQITLGQRNAEEAQKEGNLIATALRAGALPAALQQLEERSVGPSLGNDSIQMGKRAGLIGILLVVVFVTIIYRLFGFVAALCLGLNVLGLLSILSALGATLTLPGIAGITLTIGMAVDANVIIFERIKEELKRGMTMKSAVSEGFRHAFTAIFDANVASAIAASVLIYFGSGPVRGFGVTLIAGIVTTMITAVFVTRYFLDLVVARLKPSKWI